MRSRTFLGYFPDVYVCGNLCIGQRVSVLLSLNPGLARQVRLEKMCEEPDLQACFIR